MMDGTFSAPEAELDLRPKRFCIRCSDFHAVEDFTDSCQRYTGAAPIRLCKTCGGFHPLDQWAGNCMPEPNWNRSDLSAPSVIRDSLPDIANPLTGLPVDSKRALRRMYREAGVEEVGDQEQKRRIAEPSEAEIGAEVKKTIEILKSDNLSNDEMSNMMRAPAPVAAGFTVE